MTEARSGLEREADWSAIRPGCNRCASGGIAFVYKSTLFKSEAFSRLLRSCNRDGLRSSPLRDFFYGFIFSKNIIVGLPICFLGI